MYHIIEGQADRTRGDRLVAEFVDQTRCHIP